MRPKGSNCGARAAQPALTHAVPAERPQMGMESGRSQMSEGTMGAAGKMEHAPPGTRGG